MESPSYGPFVTRVTGRPTGPEDVPDAQRFPILTHTEPGTPDYLGEVQIRKSASRIRVNHNQTGSRMFAFQSRYCPYCVLDSV